MSILFNTERQLDLRISYQDNSSDPHLTTLREKYSLEQLLSKENSDLQNILILRDWVYSRWNPDSVSTPRQKNALFLLEQAEKGHHFRFRDFNTVFSACLRSLGFTIRKLWLKSGEQDIENGKSYYILYEIYLKDIDKWFFIDPRFDIMMKKDGVPINAVELQEALFNEEEVEVLNPRRIISSVDYLEWIGNYLFYFSTNLNTGTSGFWKRYSGINSQITLFPLHAEIPKQHSWLRPSGKNFLTNSIKDFYPEL